MLWAKRSKVLNKNPYPNREGETVILKCLIQAHPWVYRIMWYRDGEEIVASDRIFIDERQVSLGSLFWVLFQALNGLYLGLPRDSLKNKCYYVMNENFVVA